MQTLSAGLTVKADKIRALDRAGYSRSAIANFLGIRYQHVRNTLMHPPRPATGAQPADLASTDSVGRAELDEAARLTVPRVGLERLGVRAGDVVSWRVDGDELVLMGPSAGVRHARRVLGIDNIDQDDTAWTDGLIEERRREAERENHEPRNE